jgi:predicted transcriptional regulator
MNKKKPTNFEEFEGVLLQDHEIRKEYEDLKPKYEMIQSLIKRRNQLRMSQSQLARTVGTRQPAISRLERGEFNNVTLSTLIKIAHALDLDLDISLKAKRTKVTAQARG